MFGGKAPLLYFHYLLKGRNGKMFDKEKYLYDRREWGEYGIIVSIICIILLLFLWSFIEDRTEFILLYAFTAIVLLLLGLADQNSLRIAVTDEKMIFHQGFRPTLRRTIFFREIEGIALKNIEKYAHLRSNKTQHLSTGGLFVKAVVFKFRYGDTLYISGSYPFVQENLAITSKRLPHIKID